MVSIELLEHYSTTSVKKLMVFGTPRRMESSVQQRTGTKRSKSKKKPIKVVYISNPMKVKASASEFRALVQELTGQDAELPPDLSRFHLDHDGGGHHTTDSDNSSAVTKSDDSTGSHNAVAMGPGVEEEGNYELGKVGNIAFDDDVFTPELMDNISSFFPPPTIFYESAQLDDLLIRRLDARTSL
ncbi:sigma factor binding protein 2, chloroplastic [Senna tora]|uniref:Sigma factor binding protein 2, chloroplastic n=1 Tax=Senna tora TaxID=362788 RepID=A0A834W012_9FABA|nr:sigma factor binding protein 2, chloroplastic [Senna tora]